MNIFEVLSQGKGSINEENISSFLAYLLDPNEDHGLYTEFLERFLAQLGLKSSEIDSDNFDITLEFPVKTDKKYYIDLIFETNNYIIAIENKILESSKRKNQLQNEYDGLKESEFYKEIGRKPIIMVSNMPIAKMKDLNGNIYSTTDAVKEIYSKFQIPIVFVTSGWGVNNKFAQKTAEELCEFVSKNPECVREFAVSINPFFYGSRDKYIEKVANALKTFLPLFKNGTKAGSTLFKHNYPNGKDTEITGKNAAKKLYNEIYLKLQEITNSKLSDYERLKPEFVTRHKESNLIENKGRGQKFFSADEVSQNDKELFVESFEWMTLTPEQKQQRAYECMTKNVDINGQIYLITPSEQRISTNIGLNFINKDKKTAPIHTDKIFVDVTV